MATCSSLTAGRHTIPELCVQFWGPINLAGGPYCSSRSSLAVRVRLVEVMGRYSNHADQEERITDLLNTAPVTTIPARTRTIRQVHRRLRPDLVDELLAGYEGGLTTRQLADQFGIGRETESKILSRKGITTRHRPLTPAQTETAAQLRQWIVARSSR